MADEIKHYANCEGGEDCECEYTAWLEAEPAVPKRIAMSEPIKLSEERARLEAAIPQSMQWKHALEAAAVPSGADFIVDALASMPPLLAFAEQRMKGHERSVDGPPWPTHRCARCRQDWPCETVRRARECGIEVPDA